MNIIGNKNSFAIEYHFTDDSAFHNAKTRIWIGDIYLGHYENDSPIYGIYNYFNYLVNNLDKFVTNEFKDKRKEEIYRTMIPYESKEEYFELPNEIKIALDNYDRFIVSLNEAYYEFAMRCYIEDDNVCFVWKLLAKGQSLIEDYPNYREGINFFKVPFNELKSVVNEFKKCLEKEGILAD